MSWHQKLMSRSLTSKSILQSSTELVLAEYIYMCTVVLCTSRCVVFLYKRSSSHGSGPWEGACNQLGNKLTIDDL